MNILNKIHWFGLLIYQKLKKKQTLPNNNWFQSFTSPKAFEKICLLFWQFPIERPIWNCIWYEWPFKNIMYKKKLFFISEYLEEFHYMKLKLHLAIFTYNTFGCDSVELKMCYNILFWSFMRLVIMIKTSNEKNYACMRANEMYLIRIWFWVCRARTENLVKNPFLSKWRKKHLIGCQYIFGTCK